MPNSLLLVWLKDVSCKNNEAEKAYQGFPIAIEWLRNERSLPKLATDQSFSVVDTRMPGDLYVNTAGGFENVLLDRVRSETAYVSSGTGKRWRDRAVS